MGKVRKGPRLADIEPSAKELAEYAEMEAWAERSVKSTANLILGAPQKEDKMSQGHQYQFSDSICTSFEISDTEKKKIVRWAWRHLKSCSGPNHGLIYEFSPTGIGVKVVVRCYACKKEYDASDYGSW